MPTYEDLAGAIIELQAATDAEMDARPKPWAVYRPVQLRLIEAREAITQLAKELNPPPKEM